MKEIRLDSKENERYQIIKKFVTGKLTRKQASIILRCSEKTITRLKNRYLEEGKKGFIHKNKGRIPINKTSINLADEIINIYTEDYFDFNFTHFLDENEQLDITYRTCMRILNDHDIFSPEAHKKHRMQIEHPLRPRKAHFGELVQIDATYKDWLNNGSHLQLHLSIDDATSTCLSGFFDKEETLYGYLNVLKIILLTYGVPIAFYSDNRTVFEYKSKKKTSDDNIQFKRICNNLGIEIITTSIPQAKGRIERLNRTFKGRLLKELRLKKIKTIDEANKYLHEIFIPKYNAKFAIKPTNAESFFRPLPKKFDINLALALKFERKILEGNVLSFKGNLYQIFTKNGKPVRFFEGELISIYLTFDTKLIMKQHGKIHNLKFLRKNNNNKSHPPIQNHPFKKSENYGLPISDQNWW
jgi:transposase